MKPTNDAAVTRLKAKRAGIMFKLMVVKELIAENVEPKLEDELETKKWELMMDILIIDRMLKKMGYNDPKYKPEEA